jgi:hypothetical protein
LTPPNSPGDVPRECKTARTVLHTVQAEVFRTPRTCHSNERTELMSILTAPAPAWNADGTALASLAELLYERHYDQTQRLRILRYATANRHLAGPVESGELDPEDVAEAYQCLEESFPAVGSSADDWDTFADADHWETGPAIPPGTALVPPAPTAFELSAYWPGEGAA